MRRLELEPAYRRAIYRVRFGERDVDLRVGAPSPALDAELAARGARRWAWLTAVNPGSERLPDAENSRRLAALDAELALRGWTALPGEALDADGSWPPEPSRLLLDPDESAVAALAARWGQIAWLGGARGGPAELRWCGPRRRAQPPRR